MFSAVIVPNYFYIIQVVVQFSLTGPYKSILFKFKIACDVAIFIKILIKEEYVTEVQYFKISKLILLDVNIIEYH